MLRFIALLLGFIALDAFIALCFCAATAKDKELKGDSYYD
jgi:hypothetical protein